MTGRFDDDAGDDGLDPLITECPNCQTRFRVSENQLQQSGGRVRCGACLTVFNGVQNLAMDADRFFRDPQQAQEALDALLDELAGHTPAAAAPAPEDERAAEADATDWNAPADVSAPVDGVGPDLAEAPASGTGEPAPADEAPALVGEPSAGGQAPVAEPAAEPAALAEPLLTEVPRPEPEPAGPVPGGGDESAQTAPARAVIFGDLRRPRPLVWTGIVAGVVLLAAQVLWYQFDDWGRQPLGRAVYQPLCRVLGCELPLQRDVALLTTRNLAVRTHPDQPGRLRVDAVIVNEAPFAQPFPTLELRFTSVHGNLVAGPRFEPAEYLAGDAAGLRLIPPRTPVRIELAVEDPGPDAVNYFLRFR